MSENQEVQTTEKPSTQIVESTTVPTIIYALFLANLIVPLTALVGVIMAYINKGDAPEFLQSHYQFQIRTFWIGLLYGVIGLLTLAVFIGWIIILFTVVWLIVRCVKGFKYLNQNQPMPDPTSWMFG